MSKETKPQDQLTELKIDKVRGFWRMLCIVTMFIGFGLGITAGWFVAINAVGDAAHMVSSLKG